jgi:hypothetical protein
MMNDKLHTKSIEKICEAINCNERATTDIKVKVKDNTALRFQLCPKCKYQFFEKEDFQNVTFLEKNP